MIEHWPDCGNGWIVTLDPVNRWKIRCSGDCRCPWIPSDSTSITFVIPPRPKTVPPPAPPPPPTPQIQPWSWMPGAIGGIT